jgi:hypothetical protein
MLDWPRTACPHHQREPKLIAQTRPCATPSRDTERLTQAAQKYMDPQILLCMCAVVEMYTQQDFLYPICPHPVVEGDMGPP